MWGWEEYRAVSHMFVDAHDISAKLPYKNYIWTEFFDNCSKG